MTYEAFTRFNFMVVENLKRRNILSGQLTVTLKFREILARKLYLVIMPVYKKTLTFDEFYTAEINDSQNTNDNDQLESMQ